MGAQEESGTAVTVSDRVPPDQSETTVALAGSSADATRELVDTVTGRGSGSSSSGRAPAPVSLGDDRQAEVLRGEECARAHGFAAILMVLAVPALAFTPFLPLLLWVKVMLAVTVAGPFLLGPLWVFVRTRSDEGYTPRVFLIFGWSAAIASLPLQYCLGVFSPTPLVVTLGIYFFGQGLDRRQALLIPAFAITGYFGLALALALGVIQDRGVFTATGVPLLTQFFFVVMAPLVLTVTLWMARLSRSAVAGAVDRTTRALNIVIQREAQLAEAQQELELALRAGAGQAGRYTGARAGKYELGEVVGRGAMGEVYAATDPGDGERVAIKVLRPEAREQGQLLERFLREGQVAGSLEVPNVVRVHGSGLLDHGTPYIAMELLTGEDLAAVLRRERRLDARALADLAQQIAHGLSAAHTAGIIHRDLKPQNLFSHRPEPGAAGTWKILDFGVSKLAGTSGTLTQAAVIGTPGYMSPEQARGKDTDARSDVFSFGAVLYRAATGRPPFSGGDMPRILFDIVYTQPPRPSSVVEGLPPDVDRVLALALAKEPGDRFASATELADALTAAIAGKLPRRLRERADAVTEGHPWGTRRRAIDD